jgi:hypothetical protein
VELLGIDTPVRMTYFQLPMDIQIIKALITGTLTLTLGTQINRATRLLYTLEPAIHLQKARNILHAPINKDMTAYVHN